MTTKNLTLLLATSLELINLHIKDNSGSEYTIIPFYEQMERGSESVTISISNLYEFDYEFLEPLAKKLAPTKIKWNVQYEDGKYKVTLFF